MKKALLSLLVLMIAFTSCTREPGTVSGVVTYFFNDYQGYKPDVGANIYITTADCDSIQLALSAILNREMMEGSESLVVSYESLIATCEETIKSPYTSQSSKEDAKNRIEECRKSISDAQKDLVDQKKEVVDSVEMEKLESAALGVLLGIIADDKTISATVDGNGNYSVSLPRGEYTMIVISQGRNSSNTLEYQGKIKLSSIEVKSKQVLNEDFKIGI